MSVQERRVEELLKFFSDDGLGDPRDVLLRMGARAIAVLPKPEFSTRDAEGEYKLNAGGFAVGADLGLLVANFLVESNSGVKWEILTKPRTDTSFNEPVLVGFGRLHLNPVRGSIVEAAHALNHPGTGDSWAKIFTHWSGLAAIANV